MNNLLLYLKLKEIELQLKELKQKGLFEIIIPMRYIIEIFIYYITIIKVMYQELLENPSLKRIFGKVEIDTIIKRASGLPLKQTERNYLSRSIRPKLLAARLITDLNLLKTIKVPKNKLTEEDIIFNISRFGYELISIKEIKRKKKIILEELIGIILAQYAKPRFIESIPILLIKNKIDKFKLFEICQKYNLNNQLGYLIETSIIISNKFNKTSELNDLLGYLKKNKNKIISTLSEEKDKEYNDFLIQTSPERLKKWNLLGRYFDGDFINNAGAYL